MAEEAREDEVAGALLAARPREIRHVRLDTLTPLELNARYMRHETFQALVANIRRDGALESVPLVAQRIGDETGAWWIASGNHRVKAAMQAGIVEADVMFLLEPLDDNEFVAKQLSHNSITGEDDPATLKSLYESIDEIDWRQYAGLDDATLGTLQDVDPESFREAALTWQQISFSFLPSEADDMKQVMSEANDAARGADESWGAALSQLDPFMDALDLASRSHNITNQATALQIVLSVFQRHVDDLAMGYEDEEGNQRHSSWVPLWTIFNTESVPADVAIIMRKAVKKMQDRGDVTSDGLFRALEYWAADYLAS